MASTNVNGGSTVASDEPVFRRGKPRPSSWVPLNTKPLRTATRKLRMAVVGAGFAGLSLAHKIYHEYKLESIIELVIYEANHDLGGTWLVNRYPGVASDIPAHIYTFPFEPNPEWSAYYASGPEIWDYIKRTAQKYNLEKDIHFNHRLTEARFDEQLGQWSLKVKNDQTVIEDKCDILVSASGHLSRWRWPSIPGLSSFEGFLVHSAQWDHDFNYAGKRVAIIGNGSSAIQILPQVANVASHVTNFIRGPTWIIPGLGNKMIDGKDNHIYSEEEKDNFRNNPDALKAYRKQIQHNSNQLFSVFIKNSVASERLFEAAKKLMTERLGGNEELAKKLIPHWEVGCRRPTPGPGYLESFTKEHVSLVVSDISEITPTGIKTADGAHHEFDAIVCATGFDVSHRPPYPLIGLHGTNLADKWLDEPEAYLSMCVEGFPNFFMFSGPNAPVGHGSLISALGWTAEYILKWAKKIAEEDIKYVVVREDVSAEFNTYADEIQQTTVWTGGCRSWFKNHTVDGKVVAVWAGSGLAYYEMLESLRPEDFNIQYRSRNRFRFMGNGMTKLEGMPDADLAFYLMK